MIGLNNSKAVKVLVLFLGVSLFIGCSDDDNNYNNNKKKDSYSKDNKKVKDKSKNPDKTYKITDSSGFYYVDGGSKKNIDITLQRGKKYEFKINASGHPVVIKTEKTTGMNGVYNKGVTNNSTDVGTLTFEVPKDAPNTLYYNCRYHASMAGKLIITD